MGARDAGMLGSERRVHTSASLGRSMRQGWRPMNAVHVAKRRLSAKVTRSRFVRPVTRQDRTELIDWMISSAMRSAPGNTAPPIREDSGHCDFDYENARHPG